MKMVKYSGIATTEDGKCVGLSSEEAERLWKDIEEEKVAREKDIPDADSALRLISKAKTRLRDLGWRDGSYCPKDGSSFAVIEYGSTGIFSAHYHGKWPDGRVVMDDFLVHPHALMWKAIDELSEDETSTLKRCDEATLKHMERDARMFGAS